MWQQFLNRRYHFGDPKINRRHFRYELQDRIDQFFGLLPLLFPLCCYLIATVNITIKLIQGKLQYPLVYILEGISFGFICLVFLFSDKMPRFLYGSAQPKFSEIIHNFRKISWTPSGQQHKRIFIWFCIVYFLICVYGLYLLFIWPNFAAYPGFIFSAVLLVIIVIANFVGARREDPWGM
jgi:hypothetical protein